MIIQSAAPEKDLPFVYAMPCRQCANDGRMVT